MMEQQDLLQDFEQEIYLERASQGARFANYLIDLIFFYVLLYIGAIVYALATIQNKITSGETYSYRQNEAGSKASFYLIFYLGYLLTYTIFEGATKGRTLGKLITGTKAVRFDGSPINWKDAFLRSLCRIVPFEPFSGLGKPWHDTWTNTQVVKIRK